MGRVNIAKLPNRVETLDGMKGVMLEALDNFKQSIALSLYDNLVGTSQKNGTTPEDTGTLKKNWRVTPGNTGGSSFIQNTRQKVEPRQRPNKLYLRNWKKFTIFNNSPYVNYVNNGIRGNEHNQNFIQNALKKTEVKYK